MAARRGATGLSPPDRSKGELHRSAQREGSPVSRRLWTGAARFAAAAVLLALAACVTLTREPRGLALDDDGALRVAAIACNAAAAPPVSTGGAGLDPAAIRLLTWNVHKQADAGWDRDLARFAAASDVVLLQEATLTTALRPVLDANGLAWVMASSFIYEDADFGVLTAARAKPLASCALRAIEPLIGIPKSGLVSWFPLAGRRDTLAVVNVHSINFALALTAYDAQLIGLVATLAAHVGPIVFAGDFNTWSDGRVAALRTAVAPLELTEVRFADDRRATFLGHAVDHVLVRGLTVVDATAVAVTSSDHNPVRVTLRVDTAR